MIISGLKSIPSLQLLQSGNENADPPGRYRPARLPLGPTLRSRRTRRGYVPITRSEILPYMYTFDNPATKTQILRVDTAPQGVVTPTPLGDS